MSSLLISLLFRVITNKQAFRFEDKRDRCDNETNLFYHSYSVVVSTVASCYHKPLNELFDMMIILKGKQSDRTVLTSFTLSSYFHSYFVLCIKNFSTIFSYDNRATKLNTEQAHKKTP